jgi:ubiquinone/menaquinone biosynthesis C-methylase UbiE
MVPSRAMSRLMAMAYDRFMRASERACLDAWRGELLAGLTGDVLEIGAGTGANLPHYPPSVRRLVLTEADRFMRAKLEARVRASGRRDVEVREASADALPFESGAFDAVVSTLVLCSVPDVATTLAEVKRVLRPGGAFVYLEHVAADEGAPRLAWQRRLEPFWMRVAGNCHLTRRTGEAIRRAGFVVDEEQRESMRKALPFVRPTVRGVAHAG